MIMPILTHRTGGGMTRRWISARKFRNDGAVFRPGVTIPRDRNISSVAGKVGYDLVPGNFPVRGMVYRDEQSFKEKAAYESIKWAASERMSVVNAVLGRIIPYMSICDSMEL